MAGPYPLATLSAVIGPGGISAPPYSDIYASLQASYQGIYGSDVYLDPDSQDGQMLAIFATAINDANASCIAVYNSFSPATAVGAGLSSNVKLNGLVRQGPTNSTVVVTLVGQASTPITNGVVQTAITGDQWALPASVIIPASGAIDVTAVAISPGAIQALPGEITGIVTPTAGWQSVTNAAASSMGRATETDAQLRQRQAVSTAMPALTPLESIVANVEAIPGVTEVKAYENDTATPDAIQPGHSIALVVAGGAAATIGATIAAGKLGTGTFGTTTVTVYDQNNVPDTIYFSYPTTGRILAKVILTPLFGYTSAIQTEIENALINWVNTEVPIGGTVFLFDMIAAAKLPPPDGDTYTISAGNLTIAIGGAGLGIVDVPMNWNEQPNLALGDIQFVVQSGP
jgi:uncharacterized phage protein gp47/JayE